MCYLALIFVCLCQTEEIEYGEDLYPEPLTGPDAETVYMSGRVDRPLELMELDDVSLNPQDRKLTKSREDSEFQIRIKLKEYKNI